MLDREFAKAVRRGVQPIQDELNRRIGAVKPYPELMDNAMVRDLVAGLENGRDLIYVLMDTVDELVVSNERSTAALRKEVRQLKAWIEIWKAAGIGTPSKYSKWSG